MTSPSNIAVAFGYVRDVSMLVKGFALPSFSFLCKEGNRLSPTNIAFGDVMAMHCHDIAEGDVSRG